jgi:hypothetical protein
MRTAISLFVVWIIVTPVPVDGLLPGTQLNERPLLVVLGLIALIRAVFVGVPVVIVLVALVVVTLVVLALTIFVVPIVLRDAAATIATGAARAAVRRSELRYRFPRCTSVSFMERHSHLQNPANLTVYFWLSKVQSILLACA